MTGKGSIGKAISIGVFDDFNDPARGRDRAHTAAQRDNDSHTDFQWSADRKDTDAS